MKASIVLPLPLLSVILLGVILVLLVSSLYQTSRQVPLRPEEQKKLFAWTTGLSFGSALVLALAGMLLSAENRLDLFLFGLMEPVGYGVGLIAAVVLQARKIRYSPRVLWSFYGKSGALLAVLLLSLVSAQAFQMASMVLSITCVLAFGMMMQAMHARAAGKEDPDGWHAFGTDRISPTVMGGGLLAVCWCQFIVLQLTVSEGFQPVVTVNLLWYCLLLFLSVPLFRAKKEKPVVLFDLDGTLIDSQPLVFETFRRVFAQRRPDLQLSQEELYSFFGPTLEETFARYFPAEEIEDVIELYQKINLALHDEMVKPMDGAQTLLASLKKAGYTIGIVSNKRKKVVERGARVCHLDGYVDLIYGKEDLGKGKPDPEGLIRAVEALNGRRDNIIYAGDNPTDMLAARNMGAWAMGYSTDPRQKKALEQCGSDFLTDRLRDLEVLLVEKTS